MFLGLSFIFPYAPPWLPFKRTNLLTNPSCCTTGPLCRLLDTPIPHFLRAPLFVFDVTCHSAPSRLFRSGQFEVTGLLMRAVDLMLPDLETENLFATPAALATQAAGPLLLSSDGGCFPCATTLVCWHRTQDAFSPVLPEVGLAADFFSFSWVKEKRVLRFFFTTISLRALFFPW